MDLKPIVRQLVDERRAKGIKIQTVCDKVGRCESLMRKLECGQRPPTFTVLNAWADVFGYEIVLRRKI